MNINYLRHFVAVAQELHFGRAAHRLNIEQPPLSQSIRRFELYLGSPLFERSTHTGVRLTHFGEELLPSALRVLKEFDLVMEQARLRASGRKRPIKLGFVTAAILELIPSAIQQIKLSMPDIETVLYEGSTTELLEKLDNDEIDVCITLPTLQCPSGVQLVELKKDNTMLALCSSHPLASKELITLDDIRGENLIFFPQHINPYLYKHFTDYFNAHELNFKIKQIAKLTTTMLALVSAGLGICFIPQSAALLPFPNVVLREIPPLSTDVLWSLKLGWKPKRAPDHVSLFIEYLQQTQRDDASSS